MRTLLRVTLYLAALLMIYGALFGLANRAHAHGDHAGDRAGHTHTERQKGGK